MSGVDVMSVYHIIKEMGGHSRPIEVARIHKELGCCKDLVQEYLIALEILEFIRFADADKVILVSK